MVAPQPLAPLAKALRRGDLDLGDYIEATLDRVDELESSIRALLPEAGRRERLRAEAAALAARYPIAEERPPLFGVLLGVKDIYAADGFDTRAGSSLPPELFAMPEGPVVAALRKAGALVLGKTVTTEFAYFAPGPTGNPWDLKRTPGGSSSGSAASIAAGFCSIATGTQTIGSIARPAAFCGVAGWKPRYGRLSREGIVPFSPSVDHAGLFAPDAAGLALAASVAAGDWDAARHTNALAAFASKPPVLAVPDGPYLMQAEPEGLAGFERQLVSLAGLGFTIVRIRAMNDIAGINARHRRICAADMARVHKDWFAVHQALYAKASAELILTGQGIEDKELESDKLGREALRADLDAALAASGARFWISPSAPGAAPQGLEATGNPIMNLPWTHAGLPTLTLPAGRSAGGMPLGMQVAGAFNEDEELLALGMLIEERLCAPASLSA
ncbi:MAG TPA: amidase [Spirochaetaceae bacterium]|nr:amidase [Spirochaetaceae bacterium]